jgi:hydrogenase maturation protein HypF
MIGAPPVTIEPEPLERLRLDVAGAVQGVGFRPFIHRLALSEKLSGFVRNTAEGATLEVEGPAWAIDRFLMRLDAEIEPPAHIHARHASHIAARSSHEFVIAPSASTGTASALVLPDLATCPDCLREIFDPSDRRYLYPFTTCVHCGPRYSIIEAVPYDRVRTAMSRFVMCEPCRSEYDNPGSRRFHAETNACAQCGPQLSLWDGSGNLLKTRHEALLGAADVLRRGGILALKGLGGFQLLADARNELAVRRLRERKRRPAKPFAIMVGTLADARGIAAIGVEEEALLRSAASPIVLLPARPGSRSIAPDIAPDNPLVGIMLPYTPLHHLLMQELSLPVVATSGNRGEEPIVSDERLAPGKLAGIADLFLVHDRPILRPVDDSVVRIVAGQKSVLRHARGYAPSSLVLPGATMPVLALGGHQKSAIAVASDGRLTLGPHIADLGGPEARAAFAQAARDMTALYHVHPKAVACDRHPDYHTTHFAIAQGLPVQAVPHHIAHVLAGMLDNGLEGPVLGVAWDGSGYGGDGSIWGGEFLAVDGTRYRRAAHLLPFRLPGGEAALREPRRAALGALYAIFGAAAFDRTDLPPVQAFTPAERGVLSTMLARGVNSPSTSSAGRLFDAVAALLGLKQKASFEGEAAMAVEFAAGRAASRAPLPSPVLLGEKAPFVVDWRPTLAALVEATRKGIPAADLAAAFHEVLAEAIVAVTRRVEVRQVLLTGGCYQNARLTERAVARLREAGFEPYWHHRIPPNDGGLAAGQAVFAARPLQEVTI